MLNVINEDSELYLYVKNSILLDDSVQNLDEEELLKFVDSVYLDILEGKSIGTFKDDDFEREAGGYKLGLRKDAAKIRATETHKAKKKLVTLLNNLESGLAKLARRYSDTQAPIKARDKAKQDALTKGQKLSKQDLDKIGKKVDNPLSKTAFKKQSKQLLKDAYTKAFQLGIKSSGVGRVSGKFGTNLTKEEERWVKSAFSQEMRYFNQFFDQIVKGTSRQNILHRIKNYALTVNAIFEAGKVRSISAESLIYWVLHPAEHCPDCLELSKRSPYTKYTLPTTPKAGVTRCLMNCKCTLRYKKATPEQLQAALKRNAQPNTVIRKILKGRKK